MSGGGLGDSLLFHAGHSQGGSLHCQGIFGQPNVSRLPFRLLVIHMRPNVNGQRGAWHCPGILMQSDSTGALCILRIGIPSASLPSPPFAVWCQGASTHRLSVPSPLPLALSYTLPSVRGTSISQLMLCLLNIAVRHFRCLGSGT